MGERDRLRNPDIEAGSIQGDEMSTIQYRRNELLRAAKALIDTTRKHDKPGYSSRAAIECLRFHEGALIRAIKAIDPGYSK